MICINKNNKLKRNSGISLIILVASIIITVVLVSSVIISFFNATEIASIVTFTNDLNTIESATQSYYITNYTLPMVDGSVVMNKDEFLAIASLQDILNEEIIENNDLDSQFYTIDLNRINVKQTSYGTSKLGENDIFVISYPTMKVYYPYGLHARGTVYFSLTSKLTNIVKISNAEIDAPTYSFGSLRSIRVTKSNNWTNEMNVKLDVDMLEGEELFMSVSGGSNRLVTTSVGQNIFGFNLLSSIVNGSATMKVPTLTMEEVNYIELNKKPISERYVDLTKYFEGEIVEKVRIDLSNFSRIKPIITNVNVLSYASRNSAILTVSSQESGIKEVRYEYLTRFTDDVIIENYYSNVTQFDIEYLKSKGKKALFLGESSFNINIPKNIKDVKIVVLDKAGNISVYNQDVSPGLYIGHSIDNNIDGQLQITAKVFSRDGVKKISFSKSIDGINFTEEQIHMLDIPLEGVISKQSLPFLDLVEDRIYIKISAVNYDNMVSESKIIKVDLEPLPEILGVDVIATKNTTVDGNEALYSNPIIPKGFKAINDGAIWPEDWNKGLVIEDTIGNQFVWVPVDGNNVSYIKWTISGIPYYHQNILDDVLPGQITNEKDQITTYGGFYVARYEAGKDNNMVVSKKHSNVWNNINYNNAKMKAESMYDTDSVKSGLITGTQWDTIMKWLQISGVNVTNSRTWGNYNNSFQQARVSGYKNLQTTGYSEFWKANNIYDISGNTWEWTNELYNSQGMIRGGSYNSNGNNSPSSNRSNQNISYSNNNTGFRCVLYIK